MSEKKQLSLPQLQATAKLLRAVGNGAAAAFEQAAEEMTRHVDKRLLEREDLMTLIGRNPLGMMRLNHQNHAAFMSTVFRYSCHGLLCNIVIWVYRTYRQHKFSYEYFPAEIEAWRNAVKLHLDAASAAEVEVVYDWLDNHHKDFVRFAEQGSEPLVSDHPLYQPMLTHLLKAEFQACVGLANRHTTNLNGMVDLYVDVLQPCMVEVGRRWSEKLISVADEHLYTAIVDRVMTVTYARMANHNQIRYNGRTAVITSCQGESHGLGARMVADLLELKGWKVHFLGTDIPESEIITTLERIQPDIIGLSLVMPFHLRQVESLIERIRANCLLSDRKIMVGGPAFAWDENLWRFSGADAFAVDLRRSLEIAETWL